MFSKKIFHEYIDNNIGFGRQRLQVTQFDYRGSQITRNIFSVRSTLKEIAIIIVCAATIK